MIRQKKRLSVLIIASMIAGAVQPAAALAEEGMDMNMDMDTNMNMNMDMPNGTGSAFGSIDFDSLDTAMPSMSDLMKSAGVTGLDPSFAADMGMGEIDLSKTMEEMKSSMMTGSEAMHASIMGDSYMGTASDFSSLNGAGTMMDMNSISEQFANLKAGFDANGFGEEFKLTKLTTAGYSMNSSEVFKESFKDIDFNSMYKTYEIPSSFDAGGTIKEMEKNRDAKFAEVYNTDSFKYVKSNLKMGDIFDTAAKGIDGFDLSSYNDLSNKVDSFNLDSKVKMPTTKNLSKNLPDYSGNYKTYTQPSSTKKASSGNSGSSGTPKKSGTSTGSKNQQKTRAARSK